MAIDQEAASRNKAVWEAGNWDEVADYVRGVGPALLDAVGVEERMSLLDVGTGSGGSVAIPAAQRGANVTGSDISSVHFEGARRRAREAGVEVDWVEANALDLPFEDGSFDRVCSTFGHMFAPDQARAASELVRVCKPGGVIGFCAWTLEGSVGKMFRVTASHMPPPPPGFQPPILWGNEDHVRELLAPYGLEPEFSRRHNVFEHESFEEFRQHFNANFGPTVAAKAKLSEDEYAALDEENAALLAEENRATDGSIRYESEYLRTIARKPA